MLLTEDDLRAIDEYGVGKRRLTNRYLFGAGVVCGLDVTCAPCNSRSVVVAPGYALDCCGNDIVSGCAQTVDVIELLRELRQRTGTDCDEPCQDGPRRDYWLVVRYTERPTDPLAPYQQDDCVVGDCEFSRVREGLVFELSCDRPGAPPSLLDRLRECARTTDEMPAAAAAARALRLAALQARIAGRVATAEVPKADQPRKADFDRLAGGTPAAADAVSLVTRSTLVLAADAAGDSPKRLTDAARTMLEERGRELAGRVLTSDAMQALPADERERAARVLQTAQAPDVRDLTLTDRWWLAEGTTADAAAREFVATAAQARDEVLRRLAKSGRAGCADYRAAAGLDLDRLDERSVAQASRIGSLLLRSLGHCVCDEANPPCPSCTDLRVPLAKVAIDGCDVVDVCALDRDWVVSPRAFAYWLPIVEVLQRLLLTRCCGDPGKAAADPEAQVLLSLAREFGQLLQAPVGQPAFRDLADALGEASAADPLRPGSPPAAVPVPAPASPPAAAAAPVAAAPAALDDRLEELQAQVAALTARLDALAAGGGGTP
jgi:hypothetical protein